MAEAKRRLAAILAGDVAGYSRLMGADETGTVATLNACRDVFRQKISEHDGRVVDTAGDSVLAVFPSVVEAVTCATEVQAALAAHNDALPDDHRMYFRIGVNMGDVIEQADGTIYGDGVNVAARLETLATPGRVAVSEDVYRNIHHKMDLAFEDLGAHAVKNIADPVHAYQIGAAVAAPGNRRAMRALRARWRPLAAVGLFLALAGAWWLGIWVSSDIPQATVPGASIAVLPFENLSNDVEQAYLAEGVAVEIVAALSRFRDLFVIDRNSSFAPDMQDMPVKALGEALGVRYVLDGSLRGDEQRLRVTVRLLATEDGRQIWTQSYDETVDDILDVQDRITRRVVGAIAPRITEQEMRRAAASRDTPAEAHQALMRARYLLRQATRESYARAREILSQALDRYPDHAGLNAEYANGLMQGVWFGWTPLPQRDMGLVMDHANRAVEVSPDYSTAHRILGDAYLTLSRHDAALTEYQLAVDLNPNQADAYDGLGDSLMWLCRFEEAAAAYETAARLDPFAPPFLQFSSGLNSYFLGRYEFAAEAARKCVDRYPEFIDCHALGTAVNVDLGQVEKARLHAADVRRLDPFFETGTYAARLTCSEPAEHIRQSLREAGLE
ncbi:MAG TPA: tetratricopeptide repeat protein [Kiloniellales bacterium]